MADRFGATTFVGMYTVLKFIHSVVPVESIIINEVIDLFLNWDRGMRSSFLSPLFYYRDRNYFELKAIDISKQFLCVVLCVLLRYLYINLYSLLDLVVCADVQDDF